jgi:hypothetical protein
MLTITSNKLFYSELGIKNTKEDYIIEVSDKNLFQYLSDTIELDNDVRFERIFDLLLLNKELVNKIFYNSLNGYKIQNWLYDFNKKSTNKSKDYLRIKWFNDIYRNDISIRSTIYIDNKSSDENNRYTTINFVSLSDIKKLFVKISKTLTLRDKDYKVIKKYYKDFTLYDIIDGILREISFNGKPEDRNKRMYELDELVKRIDSGEENMYSSEEVKQHLKQKMKEYLENKKATK